MNPLRRAVLRAFGAAVLMGAGTLRAQQSYPARPVRIIVAWTPGSFADLSARLLGQKLGEAMGQTFIVENRPGATGIVGAGVVAKAASDGYTLLFNTASHASNKLLFAKLPYDPVADFAPVSMVARNVLCIAVHPSLPVRTLGELFQYAKAKPGALSYGTPGLGTPHQLAGELLKQRAGIDMVHVPYKGGGPAMTDLLGGQIMVAVAAVASVSQYIRSGQVRVLAVTDSSRYEALPEIPTVAETFQGFDVSGWGAIFAPAGTPADIVARLNAEITRVLQMPEIKRTLGADGAVATPSTPEGLAKQVLADYDRWDQVIKSGVKFK
ncbi:MAG: tripartite tricarboxylate transporter substrate binding protein [Betaproteobacteria bacterium]|nr:tripartite tricarboxylate transporter substrate binding protein [Betaproteobacteria bacterium]